MFLNVFYKSEKNMFLCFFICKLMFLTSMLENKSGNISKTQAPTSYAGSMYDETYEPKSIQVHTPRHKMGESELLSLPQTLRNRSCWPGFKNKKVQQS